MVSATICEVAMPVIFNAITDSIPLVRETAIRVLGELNTEEAISLLAQTLLIEPETSVQDIAVLVLGKSESEAAIKALLRVTQDTNSKARKKWRRWLDIFSLVFAGGSEAVKILAPPLGIPIEVGKRLYEIWDTPLGVKLRLSQPQTTSQQLILTQA